MASDIKNCLLILRSELTGVTFLHKNVLAASCKFFRDLFGASKDICYEMINVEPNAVEDVLTFVYTGK